MGLLDDAIREHLDLKRRRGADPTEIERAEREALGPVRREPEPEDLSDQGLEPELAPEEERLQYDTGGEEEWEEYEDEPVLEHPPAESVRPVPAHQPPPVHGDETVEYDVEQGFEDEGTEGEDVLEETPEFLQDTPEHDRLWFEQRPPRDFDFDG